MSVPVDLDALRGRIAEYGSSAYLVTVNDDGSPHAVSVLVEWDGTHVVTEVGGRTRRNAERGPTVTLLWPPAADPTYSLIVDATFAGEIDGESTVKLEPTAAVLHRVAGASADAPNCLPLDLPS